MAKKNHTLGKLFALTTTVAAIGGTCYVFREQIKESSIYKKSSKKVSKLIQKITDKICANEEDDFFFDEEEEDFFSDNIFSEDAKKSREYTSITINTKDTPDDDISESYAETSPSETDIPKTDDITESFTDSQEEDMKEIFPEESIPTISFGTDFTSSSPQKDTSKETEEVSAYENEGLSDVSEDPDVLEEQDKLDF